MNSHRGDVHMIWYVKQHIDEWVCVSSTGLHPQAYSQSHFGRVMAQVSIEVTLH